MTGGRTRTHMDGLVLSFIVCGIGWFVIGVVVGLAL